MAPEMRPHLLMAAAALLGAAAAAAVQPTNRPAQQQRLRDLRSEIEQRRRSETELEHSAGAIQTELDRLGREGRALRARLDQLAGRMIPLDREIAGTERQVEQHTLELDQKRDALEQTISTLYRLGRLSYLKVLLGASSAGGMLRNNRALAYLAHRDFQAIEAYRVALASLNQQQARLAAQRGELESIHGQALQAQSELEATQKQQRALLDQVRARLRENRTVRARLEGQERELMRLIERLAKPRRSRPRPAPGLPAAERLPWPVQGGVVVFPFGELREGQTVISWPGLDMWVPAESRVSAVKSGRVIYSDAVKGLGHVIVIDHGDELKSVYAKLETPRVKVGDRVEAGTVLASVLAVDPDKETNFVFSLNRAGQAVDPARWLRQR